MINIEKSNKQLAICHTHFKNKSQGSKTVQNKHSIGACCPSYLK